MMGMWPARFAILNHMHEKQELDWTIGLVKLLLLLIVTNFSRNYA